MLFCPEVRQSIANPAKTDPLLLQSQLSLMVIEPELIVNRPFFSRESPQVVSHWLWLVAPVRAVSQEGLLVHQE